MGDSKYGDAGTIEQMNQRHDREDTGTLDRQIASEEARERRVRDDNNAVNALRTRTIGVVGEELQQAMDAASRIPRLRAELDALLPKKPRARKKGDA